MSEDHSSVRILDYFGAISDPRINRNKRHLLEDILFIGLCTLLSGGETFEDMEVFGREREEWLRRYLALPNGIPSHDTFGRVFSLIGPEKFHECFAEWTQAVRERVSGEVVAIDGKSLRRTGKDKESIVHLVSAWASTNRLVLGQLQVADKSNEITAVPKLLRMLELAGCIVTTDAMGTQKNIAKEIHEADADYVLCLKGNQGTAHREVAAFLDDAIRRKEPHLQTFESVDKDHGRLETRRCWISGQIDWFSDRDQWENLRSVGVVEARREVGDTISVERRYFLCSIAPDAKNFARAVREHWGIENSLHWVLDVSLQEDQSRARTGYAAQNLALLRKLVLNLIRKDTSHKKKSLRSRRNIAAWSLSYLETLLKLPI